MSDVFIALDQNGFFQPFLFNYLGKLYQLIPAPFTGGTVSIQMWKSSDSGATWAALSSTLSSSNPLATSACLIGTKLYLYYKPGSFILSAGGVGSFDFTTDTFSTVTTSANPTMRSPCFVTGPDAAHLYVVQGAAAGGMNIGEYISNAFTSIGTLAAAIGFANVTCEALVLGTSGILHVFYESNASGSSSSPAKLGYVNVQSGTLVGTTGSTVVLSPYSDGFAGGLNYPGTGRPVQVGSTILLSYYDSTAQQLKLLTFNDVAVPTFTTSVIDSSWPITVSAPTGAWTSVLAVIGSTLYCFYTNFSNNNNGDGWLYMRTSSDAGVTWSARQQVVQHIDSQDLIAYSILVPDYAALVGTTTLGSILPVSYRNNVANSHGNFLDGRFFYGIPLGSARNYVLS